MAEHSPNGLFEFDKDVLAEAERILIVGDIHGDLESLNVLLNRHWDPQKDLVIFLGDYSDRGEFGVEVVECIFELFKQHPQRVVGLRGNHEQFIGLGEPMFSPCHIIEEAIERRGGWYKYFDNFYRDFLSHLYLAVHVPQKFLCVHGGLTLRIHDLDSLKEFEDQTELDILHGDASDRIQDERFNMSRGMGLKFGRNVTSEVCRRLGVKKIFRGHQHCIATDGPRFAHENQLVTVISSRVYSRHPYFLAVNPNDVHDITKISIWSGIETAAVAKEMI